VEFANFNSDSLTLDGNEVELKNKIQGRVFYSKKHENIKRKDKGRTIGYATRSQPMSSMHQ